MQSAKCRMQNEKFGKNKLVRRSGVVRVSGGHLCEAEAPTEATAETSALPEKK